jgi:membrane-associated phospholipid phosphatase
LWISLEISIKVNNLMPKLLPTKFARWTRSSVPLSSIVLVGCLGLLALFGWLSQEVLEKEAFGFDTKILLWLHQQANPAIDSLMLGLTNLANPEFVVILVAMSLGLLLWYRRVWAAQIFGLNCLGGLILNQGLKLIFVKPRPQLWTPLVVEHSYSFPSGHALGSLVLYGFLAVLLADRYPRYRWGIYSGASLIISAIGLSRLFLGVHYPTDIIAGYAVGCLWLTTCVWILRMR